MLAADRVGIGGNSSGAGRLGRRRLGAVGQQIGPAARVRRSDWARRHAGDPGVVARPQHLGHVPAPELGRAGCTAGTRAGPSANDSSAADASLPITPGTSRVTASITTSAAASPPAST